MIICNKIFVLSYIWHKTGKKNNWCITLRFNHAESIHSYSESAKWNQTNIIRLNWRIKSIQVKFNAVIHGLSLNYTFNYSIMISEICCEAKIGKINTKEHKDGKMALSACCKTKRGYTQEATNGEENTFFKHFVDYTICQKF